MVSYQRKVLSYPWILLSSMVDYQKKMVRKENSQNLDNLMGILQTLKIDNVFEVNQDKHMICIDLLVKLSLYF